jgi:hypothetical protein
MAMEKEKSKKHKKSGKKKKEKVRLLHIQADCSSLNLARKKTAMHKRFTCTVMRAE